MGQLPIPAELGLPGKYTSWRRDQENAVLRILDCTKPVVIPVCPTGFGKSLMYVAAAVLSGGKTVILTSTKALQDQLMRDFACIGMVEVKGKNAYLCPISDNQLSCDEAPCTTGYKCTFRSTVCPYYKAVEKARKANLVCTNYSFWFCSNAYAEGIGKPGILVCDEGHDAPHAVASFLTITFPRSEESLVSILPPNPESMSLTEWREWASDRRLMLEEKLEEYNELVNSGDANTHTYKQLAKVKALIQQVYALSVMNISHWVVNVTPFEIAFAPIDVRSHCKDLLYEGIPRVVITSASVNKKTAELLGLNSELCEMFEYEHSFPLENRIVYHVKGARVGRSSSGAELKEWLETADRIIEKRLDRKGIFHTTSYPRRDFVVAHSRFSHIMITQGRKDTISKVLEFKNGSPPLVLVSPAVTTGWDFPEDECRYQIIGKVPFPDMSNKITHARCEADPEYAAYVAMQQLVQSSGRPVRSETDKAETFIIDNNIEWFLARYRKFAPKWFLDAYTSRIFPPPPPDWGGDWRCNKD